jgi:hypothetical protein
VSKPGRPQRWTLAARNGLALRVECQVRRREPDCTPEDVCNELAPEYGTRPATLIRRYREAMAEIGDPIRAEAELWARGKVGRLIDLTFPVDLIPLELLDQYPPMKKRRGRPEKKR